MSAAFRYVRLSADDMGYFRYLDPYEKACFLNMPYGFAIGVLWDDEEKLVPAGLMIGTACEEMLTIEWIAVDPDYRYQGVGEELVVLAYKMAVSGNIPLVGAVMLSNFKRESLTEGADGYFEQRLFTKKEEIWDDLYCDLSDLPESGSKKEDDAESAFSSFENLTGQEVAKRLEKLLMIDNAVYTFPPDGFEKSLDRDICLFSEKDKKITAALLVSRMGDDLMPVYFYAKNPESGDSLINEAIARARQKYGDERGVFITMRQRKTAELLQRMLMPSEKAELLTADVSEFKKLKQD